MAGGNTPTERAGQKQVAGQVSRNGSAESQAPNRTIRGRRRGMAIRDRIKPRGYQDHRGMGAQSDFIAEQFVPSEQYKEQNGDG